MARTSDSFRGGSVFDRGIRSKGSFTQWREYGLGKKGKGMVEKQGVSEESLRNREEVGRS